MVGNQYVNNLFDVPKRQSTGKIPWDIRSDVIIPDNGRGSVDRYHERLAQNQRLRPVRGVCASTGEKQNGETERTRPNLQELTTFHFGHHFEKNSLALVGKDERRDGVVDFPKGLAFRIRPSIKLSPISPSI
jgi:hypothetical protein